MPCPSRAHSVGRERDYKQSNKGNTWCVNVKTWRRREEDPGAGGLLVQGGRRQKAGVETEATGWLASQPQTRASPPPHSRHLGSVTSAPPAHSWGWLRFQEWELHMFPHFSDLGSESRKQLCCHSEGETVPGTYPAARGNWTVTSPLAFAWCLWNENPFV